MIGVRLPIDSDSEDTQINLTPLIDVVFMLIVFLLLTASATQYVISVDTPNVDSAAATHPVGFVLYPPQDEDDNWRFNAESFRNPEDVLVAITEALERKPDEMLVIGVGANVNAQRLVDAMDVARRAGARRVDIAVDIQDS